MSEAEAATRIDKIRSAITSALAPETLDIVDESHLHAGHAGAQSGRGHFRVTVVAEKFRGQPLVKRHRMVYEAVGDLMTTDIHALSIDAAPPPDPEG